MDAANSDEGLMPPSEESSKPTYSRLSREAWNRIFEEIKQLEKEGIIKPAIFEEEPDEGDISSATTGDGGIGLS